MSLDANSVSLRSTLPALLLACALGWAAAQDPPPPANDSGLDEDLLKQLIEEPALAAPKDPLSAIAGRMKSVVERLDQRLVDRQTRELQDAVSNDLARLIAEAQKRQQQQQQQQSQQQSNQSDSQRQQVQQPKPSDQGQSKPDQTKSNEPARESTTRLQRQAAVQAAGQDRQSLLKRAWGHLPAQAREQVQSSSSEQFLPKYELETEQYFRRLADMEEQP